MERTEASYFIKLKISLSALLSNFNVVKKFLPQFTTCMHEFYPHTKKKKKEKRDYLTPAGYPIIQLNYNTSCLEIASDSKGKCSVHKTPSPISISQTPVSSQGGHLGFWSTWYRLEVPITLSLGLINLVEWLTELREIVCSRSPVHYLKISLRNSQMEEMCRAKYLHVFTKPKALWTLSFCFFYGGFIT